MKNMAGTEWILILFSVITIILLYLAFLLKRIDIKLSEMQPVPLEHTSRNDGDIEVELITELTDEQEIVAVSAAIMQILPNQKISEILITPLR